MSILASPIAPHVDALRILHGCCIALMKDVPDSSVDMILTDPPYYSTALDFDQAPHIDFKAWLMECQRILKPSGVLVSFADFNLLAELRGHRVFKTGYELVWHKSMATGFMEANLRPLRQSRRLGRLFMPDINAHHNVGQRKDVARPTLFTTTRSHHAQH